MSVAQAASWESNELHAECLDRVGAVKSHIEQGADISRRVGKYCGASATTVQLSFESPPTRLIFLYKKTRRHTCHHKTNTTKHTNFLAKKSAKVT